VIAHLIYPSLMRFEPAVVDVETAGRFTAGMTVTDFDLRDRTPNALVATAIDVARFWDLTLGAYERLAATL
jgi:purine nucleosidase